MFLLQNWLLWHFCSILNWWFRRYPDKVVSGYSIVLETYSLSRFISNALFWDAKEFEAILSLIHALLICFMKNFIFIIFLKSLVFGAVFTKLVLWWNLLILSCVWRQIARRVQIIIGIGSCAGRYQRFFIGEVHYSLACIWLHWIHNSESRGHVIILDSSTRIILGKFLYLAHFVFWSVKPSRALLISGTLDRGMAAGFNLFSRYSCVWIINTLSIHGFCEI